MNKEITRAIARAEAWIRDAKRNTVPCGVNPPNEHAARQKLAMAVRELEGALS